MDLNNIYLNDPQLYEALYREHCRQIRDEIARNRMQSAQQQRVVLQWLADAFLRAGHALQNRCEQKFAQMHKRSFHSHSSERFSLSR